MYSVCWCHLEGMIYADIQQGSANVHGYPNTCITLGSPLILLVAPPSKTLWRLIDCAWTCTAASWQSPHSTKFFRGNNLENFWHKMWRLTAIEINLTRLWLQFSSAKPPASLQSWELFVANAHGARTGRSAASRSSPNSCADCWSLPACKSTAHSWCQSARTPLHNISPVDIRLHLRQTPEYEEMPFAFITGG